MRYASAIDIAIALPVMLLIFPVLDHFAQKRAAHLARKPEHPPVLRVRLRAREPVGDEIGAGQDGSCVRWEIHPPKGRLRGMEFFGACPLDCPDGCSWVVTVEDGEATRLRGNRDHPYTAGALCAKVNGYLDHARADDRLLYPMRRVGAKGEGNFERISWDEATAEIAHKLHAIKDEFGGEAIWPFQGTGSLGYVQGLEGRAGQPLWNVLGASRHEMTALEIPESDREVGRDSAARTRGRIEPTRQIDGDDHRASIAAEDHVVARPGQCVAHRAGCTGAEQRVDHDAFARVFVDFIHEAE